MAEAGRVLRAARDRSGSPRPAMAKSTRWSARTIRYATPKITPSSPKAPGAASESEEARNIEDSDLLAYATTDGRAVVTENASDFVPLAVRWAAEACEQLVRSGDVDDGTIQIIDVPGSAIRPWASNPTADLPSIALDATVYTFDAVDRLLTATTPSGSAKSFYLVDGLLQHTEYKDSSAVVRTVEKRCAVRS